MSDQREAFEKWIAKDGGDLSKFGTGRDVHYVNSAVNNAWTGWQAALTQPQPQAQQAKCSHVWHAGLMTSGGYEAVCAKCGLRPEAAQFQAQQAEIDYVPGTWFKSQSVDQTQAFYLSRLPAIREAAREHGYAIGVHGSTRRDFDLIAMQWREGASDKDTLAHAIAMAACGIDRQGAYEWEEKGAGRVACSIPICWTPHPSEVGAGHIDLSLIKAQQATAAPALIGWRTDDYLKETSDIGTARGWDVHYKILPIFEGDRYTKLSSPTAACAHLVPGKRFSDGTYEAVPAHSTSAEVNHAGT